MILDPYDPKLDYYQLLDVRPSAGEEELRRAFYRAVRKVHPDLNAGPRGSTAQTQRVNRSKILLTPSLRAEYDRLRLGYWAQRGKPPPRQSNSRRRIRPSRRAAKRKRAEAEAWARLARGFLQGLIGGQR